jgi:hypothetical protein
MDRVSDYFSNINIRDKKNIISSVLAGVLFSSGWWVAIDAATAYPSNDDLLKASHACGAVGTLALIMINSVTNNQIRGESMYSDGCFGKSLARIWIFIGFLLSFGSLIGSIWIFFDHYVYQSDILTFFFIN